MHRSIAVLTGFFFLCGCDIVLPACHFETAGCDYDNDGVNNEDDVFPRDASRVDDCEDFECGRSNSGLTCGTCGGDLPDCVDHVCVDDCAGLECGDSPNLGIDCGTCEGETETCEENLCIDDCDGLECGESPAQGFDCGSCASETAICEENLCVDDCEGLECGDSPNLGIDCGTCEGERPWCLANQCVAQIVEWVEIEGDTFTMGSDSTASQYPAHSVAVPTFQMTKTEVTQSQYRLCFEEGVCSALGEASTNCVWNDPTRAVHPANCLTWTQANTFCAFVGGRLPSEAEWEFAARSGGKNNVFPWGNAVPSCDFAIITETDEVAGCGENRPWPVCSKPGGNTEQGLCDMAGNVWEWVEDFWHQNYVGAPTDGSAWLEASLYRVCRGGSYSGINSAVRTRYRTSFTALTTMTDIGFRCAK